MQQAMSWSGFWWTPDAPDTHYPGTLSFDPASGLRLHLISGLPVNAWVSTGPSEASLTAVTGAWPLILGQCGGTQISLLDCNATHTLLGDPFGGPTGPQTVSALRCLAGTHLAHPLEPVFKAVEMSIEYLTAWSGQNVFSASFGVADEEFDGSAVMKVTPVAPVTVELDELAVALKHRNSLIDFEREPSGITGSVSDAAIISVRSDVPLALSGYFEFAKGLQDLLSLATGRPAQVLWQTMLRDRENPEHQAVLGDKRVEYYSKQNFQPKVGPQQSTAMPEFVFTLRNIDFSKVIRNWFQIRNEYAEPCNMVLGLWYMPDGYVQTQVITAVAAAEALHRRLGLDKTAPPPPIPTEEFEKFLTDTIAAADPRCQEWLAGRITQKIGTGLRRRLWDLRDRPDKEAMVALVPNVKRWATLAADTRSGLAHAGSGGALEPEELFAISRVTAAVVLMNLLFALGISPKLQRAIVQEHPTFSHAAELARTHLA